MKLELIAYAIGGASLVFLAWMYLVAIRNLQDETTRQKLFNVRSELWDFAHLEKIDRRSDAYQILRTTLNGYLRYVHRLGLYQIIIMAIYCRLFDHRQPYEDEFSKALNRLPSEQRNILKELRRRMALIILRHILITSWILRPLTLFIPVLQRFQRMRSDTVKVFGKLTRQAGLDRLAMSEGLRCTA